MGTLFPMVGREMELETLRAYLAAAQTGKGSLVLVGGEAGAGKSTLVENMVATAATEGMVRTAVGRCPGPGETPPFGPWLEALAGLGLAADSPENPLAPAGYQTIREQATALLALLNRHSSPLLIVLEDMHWSDPGSLDLLRHLTPLLAQSHLLAVATYRNDELNRDHPLWTLLPGLQRNGAHRLTLERLALQSVTELVAAVTSDPGGELARRLYHRTGGNPLFLRELLSALSRHGRAEELAILPETVLQAIDLKLKQLSHDAQHLLSIAALIGERFDYTLLEAVADQTEESLAHALEESLSRRIIRPEGTQADTFAFEHALVREALLLRMIAPRRRRYHINIAEALMRNPQPDSDLVALHLSRADDPRAVEWLMSAGDRALRLGAVAQARQQYERAMQLLQGPDRRRGELLLKAGHCCTSHDPDQALQYWEEALSAAGAAGDQAVLLWTRHMILREKLRRGEQGRLAEMEALEPLQEAQLQDLRYLKLEGDLFGQPCGYARIATDRARALAMSGRVEEAEAVLEAIQSRIRPGVHLAEVIYARFPIYLWSGQLDRKLEVFREVRDWRLQLRQYRLAASMVFNKVYALLQYRTDRVEEIEATAAELEEYERLAIERAGEGTTAGGFSPLGIYQFYRGDWRCARRNLIAYYRAYPEETRALRRITAAAMAIALGEYGEAHFLLSALSPLSPEENPGTVHVNIDIHYIWAAWHMDQGRLEEARAWIDSADRWSAYLGTQVWRGFTNLARSRLLVLEGDPEQAYQVIMAALSSPAACNAFYWQLGGRRQAGELAAALGRQAEAEGQLTTALEMAERCRIPYEAALTRLALATALPNHPDGPDHLRSARETLAELGALPALRRAEAALENLAGTPGADGGGDGLTEREREIVRLVAQGMTYKEIGSRLFISPRTVDRHLRNIFVKLGISSRSALGAYAVRAGLLG